MSGSDEKFLVGAQAAEFLGVKPATLYAYASRGQIESVPGASGRERCYRLSDLIRLRQSARGVKSARDSEPAVWTGPAIKSAITEIREDGHRYRGQNAIALALKKTSFEDTAELLWDTGGKRCPLGGLEPFECSSF
ncbi:MAG: helix-turn-helix domain-containing protein, partial [Candidatus Competibacteraceae bacterium]|nr:helix-turn-helix domain-containing protein [Candidatus Competibacteraceae bacterium]